MAENDESKVENLDDTETEETLDDVLDEDTTDWKAEAIKARGIAKRNATRLEKLKLDSKVEKKVEKVLENKQGFGYAEKAYLRAEGITASEFAFVEEAVKETGKSIEDVLGSKWFQAQLKEAREEQATKDATPSGSKRSSSSTKDNVDYWKNKPFSEVPKEMRSAVLKAREKQEESHSHFSDRSVV